MTQRLRLIVVILIVAGVACAVVAEMMVTIFVPTLQWQRERVADRAAYTRIAPLHTRTAVESVLTAGWKATTAPQPVADHCAILTRLPQATKLPCTAAEHAVIYQRTRLARPGPLQPLRILVIYGARDRVDAMTILD
jgi:hypothetical protein